MRHAREDHILADLGRQVSIATRVGAVSARHTTSPVVHRSFARPARRRSRPQLARRGRLPLRLRLFLTARHGAHLLLRSGGACIAAAPAARMRRTARLDYRSRLDVLRIVGAADLADVEPTLSAARFAAIIVVVGVVGRIAPNACGRSPLVRVVVAARAAAAAAAAAGQFGPGAAIAHFSNWGPVGLAGVRRRGRWAHRRRVDGASGSTMRRVD